MAQTQQSPPYTYYLIVSSKLVFIGFCIKGILHVFVRFNQYKDLYHQFSQSQHKWLDIVSIMTSLLVVYIIIVLLCSVLLYVVKKKKVKESL